MCKVDSFRRTFQCISNGSPSDWLSILHLVDVVRVGYVWRTVRIGGCFTDCHGAKKHHFQLFVQLFTNTIPLPFQIHQRLRRQMERFTWSVHSSSSALICPFLSFDHGYIFHILIVDTSVLKTSSCSPINTYWMSHWLAIHDTTPSIFLFNNQPEPKGRKEEILRCWSKKSTSRSGQRFREVHRSPLKRKNAVTLFLIATGGPLPVKPLGKSLQSSSPPVFPIK